MRPHRIASPTLIPTRNYVGDHIKSFRLSTNGEIASASLQIVPYYTRYIIPNILHAGIVLPCARETVAVRWQVAAPCCRCRPCLALIVLFGKICNASLDRSVRDVLLCSCGILFSCANHLKRSMCGNCLSLHGTCCDITPQETPLMRRGYGERSSDRSLRANPDKRVS